MQSQDAKVNKRNRLLIYLLYLYIGAKEVANRSLGLTVLSISKIWNQVCQYAGVANKSPHSARHAMGKHVMKKTGNIAAVQRQLKHKNAAYSMQYARITDEEAQQVLDER